MHVAQPRGHVEQGNSQEVGGTGREGFVLSFGRPNPQDGGEDVYIGDDDDEEHRHGNDPIEGYKQKLIDVVIRAGEFQQRVSVTEVMVDDIGSTKRQRQQATRLD